MRSPSCSPPLTRLLHPSELELEPEPSELVRGELRRSEGLYDLSTQALRRELENRIKRTQFLVEQIARHKREKKPWIAARLQQTLDEAKRDIPLIEIILRDKEEKEKEEDED